MEKERNVVFIDTGGTFSDTIILKENGEFITGKASTTPDNLAEGFFASLEAACRNMGKKTSKEVLPATVGIGYGTTQGTNILVTRANAPKIGSGGSLSPRGDYRAPSDSEDTPWIEDLKNIPEG